MKKLICLFLAAVLVITCAACSSSNKTDDGGFAPDIPIEQLEWSVSAGTVKGDNYVLLTLTNNSAFSIQSLKLDFTEKTEISKDDKSSFYADIQKSQGFDDEWMQKYIESRDKLSQPISMYARIEDEVRPGATIDKVKCYYFGGWTSKDVLHPDLFVPEKVTIGYEKNGVCYTLYYNFLSKLYDVETSEKAPEESSEPKQEGTAPTSGISGEENIMYGDVTPAFKEAMDSYEQFFNEYVAFMKKYSEADNAISMMNDYVAYMQQYSETMQKLNEISSNDITPADYTYYLAVMARINKKLAEMDGIKNEGGSSEEKPTEPSKPNAGNASDKTPTQSTQPAISRYEQAANTAHEILLDYDYLFDADYFFYVDIINPVDLVYELVTYYDFSEEEADYAVYQTDIDWSSYVARYAWAYCDTGWFADSLDPINIYQEFENCGYSDEELKYAVDNCGVDWNEYARFLAEVGCGDTKAQIKSRLLELRYTTEQVEYALKNAEIDWVTLISNYVCSMEDRWVDYTYCDDCGDIYGVYDYCPLCDGEVSLGSTFKYTREELKRLLESEDYPADAIESYLSEEDDTYYYDESRYIKPGSL